MSDTDVIRELTDAVSAGRDSFAPGTPEKYPRASVSVRILALEAALAELSVLRGQLAAAEVEVDAELRTALVAAQATQSRLYSQLAASESALAAATTERDEAVRDTTGALGLVDQWRQKHEEAEARLGSGRESHDATLKQLRDALREIDDAEIASFMNNHGIDQTEDDTSLVQRIARAALAVPVAPSEDMTFVWLVERGQAEMQVPTVWWVGDADARSREGESWTQDAWQASRFTEAEARSVVDRLFCSALDDCSARAVEHGFVVPSEDEPGEGQGLIECDGGPHCGAARHIHGCFADKGNCDHPSEYHGPVCPPSTGERRT